MISVAVMDKVTLLCVKDGRLRVNDQLIEVNGVSLSGMDNSRAVQVLREAMMKDGRIHGFIGITVLRPRAVRDAARSASPCRELRVSQADSGDVGGVVSTLPRPDPVERLAAVGVGDRGIHSAADLLSANLPAHVAQVPYDHWISAL